MPQTVHCGHCIDCKLDLSRQWAIRIMHEAQLSKPTCYITLTYAPKFLPPGGTLDLEDWRYFIKKLRRKTNPNIRYYHSGEYGEATQKNNHMARPHYHAILFNIAFPDLVHFKTQNNIPLYTSKTLTEIWGKGHCSVGNVTMASAAYVARYIMKKITGLRAEQHYERIDTTTGQIINLQPEYITMSLRPGIGKDFYEKYKSDFFPSDECPIPGNGVYKKIPRYYEGLYAKENPEILKQIKKRRATYLAAHKQDHTPQRLEDQYKVKKAQLNQLPRHNQ